MTLQEIIKTALTNPTRFFDPHYMLGVYVVSFEEDTVCIQATYSGELIRELPQHLIESAQIKLGTGFTYLNALTTEEIPFSDGQCYTVELTLT